MKKNKLSKFVSILADALQVKEESRARTMFDERHGATGIKHPVSDGYGNMTFPCPPIKPKKTYGLDNKNLTGIPYNDPVRNVYDPVKGRTTSVKRIYDPVTKKYVIDPKSYAYNPLPKKELKKPDNVTYVKKKALVPIYGTQEYVGSSIIFSQIGSNHLAEKKNNQDSKVKLPNAKIVVDGCGGAKFSEIGSNLFIQLIANEEKFINENNFEKIVDNIFERLTSTIFTSDVLIERNLLFTILCCIETEDSYCVYYCGDGYIITYNGKHVDFIQIDNGEYPEYYAYNYFADKKSLGKYQKGLSFNKMVFPKSEYENVGVSTDGLRFYSNMKDENQLYLLRALKNGNPENVARILLMESKVFLDDLAICM